MPVDTQKHGRNPFVVAAVFGPAVGVKIISRPRALLLFAGALLFQCTLPAIWSEPTAFLSTAVERALGWQDVAAGSGKTLAIAGMLASTLTTGAWTLGSAWMGWPVSTTDVVLFAMLGASFVAGVARNMTRMAVALGIAVAQPLLAALLSAGVHVLMQRYVNRSKKPLEACFRVQLVHFPLLTVVAASSLTFLLYLRYQKNKLALLEPTIVAILLSAFLAVSVFFITRHFLIPRIKIRVFHLIQQEIINYIPERQRDEAHARAAMEQRGMVVPSTARTQSMGRSSSTGSEDQETSLALLRAERALDWLTQFQMYFAAVLVGAASPQYVVWLLKVCLVHQHRMASEGELSSVVAVLVAVALFVGAMFAGGRIVRTVGTDIVSLNSMTLFAVETGSLLSLIVNVHLGLPVYFMYSKVLALVTVGYMGRSAQDPVDWRVVGKIAAAWTGALVLVPLLAAALTYGMILLPWAAAT